ncbi:MAG: glycerol-3-phosphate dehydrogenase [Rhodospirillales bacterium]|jgi:glycerol-3-phosphate dehydrogenase|nr:glycerol-3-phosphate dehydrogenase [Rhodospirillales bacterium]
MNNAPALFDIFIVGGGINGCGIARDAAGRGYKVFLAEQDDFASGTSSRSTKLIHGGLRYLEHYEFMLVRKALIEREILWKMAPHIIKPLRFILPHYKGLRPAWFLRLGLFFYDHLGGRKLLPPTRDVNLKSDETGTPLQPAFTKAFEYSDCWVDDARLVVLNAMDARSRGAVIKTQTKVIKSEQIDGVWHVHTEDQQNGEQEIIQAKILVNATGPWVDQYLGGAGGQPDVHNVRLVLGSHIIVEKMFDHDKCYIFQNVDGRIIFAIPYENDFTMIGTTDLDYVGDPGEAEITEDEIEYLCTSASQYFKNPVARDQVIWQFCGVRPLFDDGASKAQEATRDYILRVDKQTDKSGLINIFGGKITTYRRLSEAVIEKIEAILGPKKPVWTKGSYLPGGDFPVGTIDNLVKDIRKKFPFLDQSHAMRLATLYGTITYDILQDAKTINDLGRCFGANLYKLEVDYLMVQEFAVDPDDILYRRTKLGLLLSDAEKNMLKKYMH